MVNGQTAFSVPKPGFIAAATGTPGPEAAPLAVAAQHHGKTSFRPQPNAQQGLHLEPRNQPEVDILHKRRE